MSVVGKTTAQIIDELKTELFRVIKELKPQTIALEDCGLRIKIYDGHPATSCKLEITQSWLARSGAKSFDQLEEWLLFTVTTRTETIVYLQRVVARVAIPSVMGHETQHFDYGGFDRISPDDLQTLLDILSAPSLARVTPNAG